MGTNDLSLKKLASKYKIKFVKREEKYCDETKTNATEMVKNMLQFFDSSKSDQVRKVIGDETIEQRWVWLEEE